MQYVLSLFYGQYRNFRMVRTIERLSNYAFDIRKAVLVVGSRIGSSVATPEWPQV